MHTSNTFFVCSKSLRGSGNNPFGVGSNYSGTAMVLGQNQSSGPVTLRDPIGCVP